MALVDVAGEDNSVVDDVDDCDDDEANASLFVEEEASPNADRDLNQTSHDDDDEDDSLGNDADDGWRVGDAVVGVARCSVDERVARLEKALETVRAREAKLKKVLKATRKQTGKHRLCPHDFVACGSDSSVLKQAKDVLVRQAFPANSTYTLHLSLAMLSGYVEQQGPNCGAASVASMVNALCGLTPGTSERACTLEQVLEFYLHTKDTPALHRTPPSTANIGNRNIIAATQSLCAARNTQLNAARTLCARTPVPCDISVAPSDSLSTRTTQWRRLTRFLTPACSSLPCTSALLFHLTNHYAPIYGFREYTISAKGRPKCIRQILTSTMSQRAKTWMDWERVHSILCSAGSYQILYFERKATHHKPKPIKNEPQRSGESKSDRPKWV